MITVNIQNNNNKLRYKITYLENQNLSKTTSICLSDGDHNLIYVTLGIILKKDKWIVR